MGQDPKSDSRNECDTHNVVLDHAFVTVLVARIPAVTIAVNHAAILSLLLQEQKLGSKIHLQSLSEHKTASGFHKRYVLYVSAWVLTQSYSNCCMTHFDLIYFHIQNASFIQKYLETLQLVFHSSLVTTLLIRPSTLHWIELQLQWNPIQFQCAATRYAFASIGLDVI
jgi:hypothetical protein